MTEIFPLTFSQRPWQIWCMCCLYLITFCPMNFTAMWLGPFQTDSNVTTSASWLMSWSVQAGINWQHFYPISFELACPTPNAKCFQMKIDFDRWVVVTFFCPSHSSPSLVLFSRIFPLFSSFSSWCGSVFVERANVSANQMIWSIAPGRRERVAPPTLHWPTTSRYPFQTRVPESETRSYTSCHVFYQYFLNRELPVS